MHSLRCETWRVQGSHQIPIEHCDHNQGDELLAINIHTTALLWVDYQNPSSQETICTQSSYDIEVLVSRAMIIEDKLTTVTAREQIDWGQYLWLLVCTILLLVGTTASGPSVSSK